MKNRFAAAFVLLALTLIVVVAATAFKPLVDMQSVVVQCTEQTTEDGGYGGQAPITGSYNSLVCANTSDNPVYVGGSTVTSDDGFRICAADECEARSISVDTYTGQLFCLTTANLDGGYQPIRCLVGR
jgi:hypothetical protein